MTLLGIFSPLLWILYAKQSEFPGLYDHSFKLCSANKLIQRKMLFWCFFRPQPQRSFGVSVCLSHVRPCVIAFLYGLELLARTSSYLEKNTVLANVSKCCHFRWPNLVENAKRHINTSGPVIGAYFLVSMTFCSKVLARTSSFFEKRLLLDILAELGHFRWAKLSKGTYTPRDLSLEPLTKSL